MSKIKRFKPKEIIIQIKGVDWRFKLIAESTYKRIVGSDSDAATLSKDRTVLFHLKGLSINTIKHELFHTLVDSSDTYSMDMTLDNLEELAAVIFANYSTQAQLWAEQIMDHFLRE
jgi:hypothetical protein